MATEHGKVAGSLNAAGFNKKATQSGIWGEKQTAQALTAGFTKDHDVHIFHDLKIPTLQEANIDHVIVKGNTIIVIDSKNWRPAIYWNLGNKGFRGLKPFNGLTKRHVQAAVAYYQSKHPSANVHGIIMCWSKQNNAKYTFLTRRLDVKFVHGNKGVKAIKKLFNSNKAGNPTDPKIVGTLKRGLIK